MKRVRYTKYNGDLASELDMEDLLEALSDYLLDSGFRNPLMEFQDLDQTMEDLKEALRRAMESGELFDKETQEKIDQLEADGKLDQFLDQLMERMERENYIQAREPQPGQGGRAGNGEGDVRFEVTDKSLDFLGFKTLRDLLGSLGKSSAGRHDTRHWATGVEASGASKQYEFGDTLNLDTTATLSAAIARQGTSLPLEFEYADLQVHQSEYQSSCATVVMLDCSHSMILYGEDRFTPAKKRGDGAVTPDPHAVSRATRCRWCSSTTPPRRCRSHSWRALKVGPYITPTRARGCAWRTGMLDRQRKDMKQIVMITDGKPSALTLPDGRIYKNAFGLDPLVVSRDAGRGEPLQAREHHDQHLYAGFRTTG